jgi:hypothetical protein
MEFTELELLFVKISQKRRFPGVFLGCRLKVRRSPRLIFVQSVAIYRQIWPWGANGWRCSETITLAPLNTVMATFCIQKYVCNQIQVEKALLTLTVTKQKHIRWENVLSKQGFSLFKTVTEILQRTHY